LAKLNVGGVSYETTKSTLIMLPYFRAIFSGSFELIPDSEGFYFIDRDWKTFEYLLSFLRGSLLDEAIKNMSSSVLAGLYAEFYHAPDMLIEILSPAAVDRG
jgi:hypothetical protein